jgi:predicted nucleic acid-binding protein
VNSPPGAETAALVDSSFFVRQQRFGLDGFAELAQWCCHYELLSCGMVRMEVLHGIRSARALQRYAELFAAMREIPTTARTWDRAIEIARHLAGMATPIPPQAALIAAHALEAGAAIITLDTDYRRVPGLTVLQRLP